MSSFWKATLVAISCVLLTPVMASAQPEGNPAEKPPIGDFYSGSTRHGIQIIEEKPILRDFREAPQDPKELDADNESADMRAAWGEWHKRVAGAILQRYATFANVANFRSRPLTPAVAVYTVTSDGRILNARLIRPNINPTYDAICLRAIDSLNGNLQILQFPKGSCRLSVNRVFSFIQNNAIGELGRSLPDRRSIGDFGPNPYPGRIITRPVHQQPK